MSTFTLLQALKQAVDLPLSPPAASCMGGDSQPDAARRVGVHWEPCIFIVPGSGYMMVDIDRRSRKIVTLSHFDGGYFRSASTLR